MPALGQLLLADGVCTPEQLEEAVQNQVALGGRIGTNLVELGVLDEATLAAYLGRQHGRPYLAGELQPEARALELLNAEQAGRLEMVPYLIEGRRLQVLCADPGNITALDELAFITGLKPDPIVVAEIRLWQLLRYHYGLERGLRLAAIASRDYLAASLAAENPAPASEPGEELISEEAFAQLYQRRDGFPQTRHAEGATSPEQLPFLAPEDLEEVDEEEAAGPPGNLERRVWQAEADDQGRRREDRLLAEAAGSPASVPPPVEPADESPLDYETAVRLLAEAEDRYAMARVLLRHARSQFARALLFTVHRGVALGFDAVGTGLDRLAVRSLLVPLQGTSLFALVYKTRAHYLGPLHKTRANIDFLRALGKQVPLSGFAMPVLVRGRVVNIFYGDNGHRQHCSADIGGLLILAQKMNRAYQQLFERKRLVYRRAGAGPASGREFQESENE